MPLVCVCMYVYMCMCACACCVCVCLCAYLQFLGLYMAKKYTDAKFFIPRKLQVFVTDIVNDHNGMLPKWLKVQNSHNNCVVFGKASVHASLSMKKVFQMFTIINL